MVEGPPRDTCGSFAALGITLTDTTISAWIEDNVHLRIALGVGWIALVMLASALYRSRRGKGIPKPAPKDIVFKEDFASGRSLKSWRTRWGGARNCLVVTVTHSSLLIRPFFPFNLMFLPETFDLEHAVDLGDLRDARKRSGFMRDKVVVEFPVGGANRRLELWLRDADDFLKAIGF